MIDLDAVFRSYFVGAAAQTTNAGAPSYAGPTLAVLAGERIYAGTDLPAGYHPDPTYPQETPIADRGPAVLFNVRAGPVGRAPMLFPFIQIKCYGKDEATARQLDRALFDHLHGTQTRDIKSAWLSVIGQLSRDPEPTNWPFVQSTYRAITRS